MFCMIGEQQQIQIEQIHIFKPFQYKKKGQKFYCKYNSQRLIYF